MTISLPRALILKEGRALAPIWVGAAVTVVIAAQAGMLLGSLFAFVLGAAALGVFSIGHEYAHRTMTSLLAQPLTRSRLLMSKAVVLAPLLVLLSLVAALALLQADGIERLFGRATREFSALATEPVDKTLASRWQAAILVLTPLLGLCVAPWLTMVSRNMTAGLVFTLSIPAGLWIAGQIARAASVNFDFVDLEVGNAFGYRPALTLMTVGMIAVAVIGVVHGRMLFVRLEALDAPRGLTPALKARIGSKQTISRRRHPLTLLLRKEIRLHGLAFAVAILYALGWIAMRLTRTDLYIAGQSFATMSGLYGVFIAMLVGAMSSAEERALGTSEWQTLQPYAFWKQWMVKVLTVSAIALLLGLAVPIGLEAAFPLIGDSGSVGPRLWWWFVLPGLGRPPSDILLIVLFSAYASTLCVGGLRALLVVPPVSFGLASLYANLTYAMYSLERFVLIDLYGRELWWVGLPTATNAVFSTVQQVSLWTSTLTVVGFVVLILFLALRNSRSAERGTTMARKQLPWVAVYVALAAVLTRGGHAVLEWWLLSH